MTIFSMRLGEGGQIIISQFNGTAFEPVAYVETQYLWLLFPSSLILFTLIFLLSTIRKSQQLGSRVWKSSVLATLQGLHPDLYSHLGGLSSISEMEEKAEDIQIQFDMKVWGAEKDVEYQLVESKQDEGWLGGFGNWVETR